MSDETDELSAMSAIRAALEPLTAEAQRRALQWAISRYLGKAVPDNGVDLEENPKPSAAAFESFADLYDAARPNTDAEKALIAGYWQQVCCGNANFSAQSLNDLLKDMGYGVSNITVALNNLKEQHPALVLQLQKNGTSRQSRKVYKLNHEGIRRAQGMVREQE